MLGVSFTEFILIALVAFLIVGPKRLSGLLYEIGKWLGKIKAEFNYIKETQINNFDDSSLYEPEMDFNKTVDEVKEKED